MNLVFIIFGILAFLILFILLVRINVSFIAEYKDKKFDFKLRVYILNTLFGKDIKFSKSVSQTEDTAEENDSSKEDNDQKKTLGEFVSDIKKSIKKFIIYKDAFFMTRNKIRKKFVFKSLNLSIDYGDGDAHTTAVSVGGMWGFIYNVLGFITKTATVKKHTESVNPMFNQKVFAFKTEGIFAVRTVHIIYALILFKSNYRKILKTDTDKKGV